MRFHLLWLNFCWKQLLPPRTTQKGLRMYQKCLQLRPRQPRILQTKNPKDAPQAFKSPANGPPNNAIWMSPFLTSSNEPWLQRGMSSQKHSFLRPEHFGPMYWAPLQGVRAVPICMVIYIYIYVYSFSFFCLLFAFVWWLLLLLLCCFLFILLIYIYIYIYIHIYIYNYGNNSATANNSDRLTLTAMLWQTTSFCNKLNITK